MPSVCCVKFCGSNALRDNVGFFRIPKITNYRFNQHSNLLSKLRRQRWLEALRRTDFTELRLNYWRVCARHFFSGRPAPLADHQNLDWVPSLNMGYTKTANSTYGVKNRSNRKELKEVSEDMKKHIKFKMIGKGRKIQLKKKSEKKSLFPGISESQNQKTEFFPIVSSRKKLEPKKMSNRISHESKKQDVLYTTREHAEAATTLERDLQNTRKVLAVKHETQNDHEHNYAMAGVMYEYHEDELNHNIQTRLGNSNNGEDYDEIVKKEIDEIDWTKKTLVRFLELYQLFPCLWNPKDISYKSRNKENDAWIYIKINLGISTTIEDLKKKRDSLMSMYRRYKVKIEKLKRSGNKVSKVYKPTWFAYMDSFLGTLYECSNVMDFEDDVAEDNDIPDFYDYDTDSTLTSSETDEINQNLNELSSLNFESQVSAVPKSGRKRHKNSQFHRTDTQTNQNFSVLKTILQQPFKEEEDECHIFGKLVAEKMRRLSEERRDLLMLKINRLFYSEFHERHNSKPLS